MVFSSIVFLLYFLPAFLLTYYFVNKQIYPNSAQSPLETSQINLEAEISQHNVIIIMATEVTFPGLGWGFIENTYNLFKGI